MSKRLFPIQILTLALNTAWHDINFFENDFSKDVGEILFGHQPANQAHLNLMSPDNTSDGWLKKKWVIADGKRMLMKVCHIAYAKPL